MIKSFLSFFASGFFRKLGQIAAFLVIALLGVVFLNNKNIKLPRFLQFGIIQVNASEKVILNKCAWRYRIHTTLNDTYAWSNGEVPCGNWLDPGLNETHQLDAFMIRVGSNSKFLRGQSYRISINLQTENPVFGARPLREVICGGSSTSSWSSNESLISECTQGGYLTYNDGNKTSYYVDVVPSSDVYGIQLQIYFNRNLALYGPWYFTGINILDSTNATYNKDSTQAIDQQTNIINNQFNTTNENINNLTDTLKDTDTSSDSNDMGSFLNNLTLSSDGSISSLLNIPITFIQNVLTNSNDQDYCTDYKNKHICLPSGSLIWGRSDSSGFRVFFSIIVGGFLCYKMLRSFIKTTLEALNPKTDRVEVMKL